MFTIFVGVVCLFVGWAIPEPQWAKDLVAKIKAKISPTGPGA